VISTFAPATNVPVPADYVVGPDDELDVQLYGSRNDNLQLLVGRDGRVSFLSWADQRRRADLQEREGCRWSRAFERQMIGRACERHDGRDAHDPGVSCSGCGRPRLVSISGLGTITRRCLLLWAYNRSVRCAISRLKRRGELVRRLDLYDMLIAETRPTTPSFYRVT